MWSCPVRMWIYLAGSGPDVGKAPRIYPDYSGVVFPLNIAPPNFVIQEEGDRFQAAFGHDGKVDLFVEEAIRKLLFRKINGKN